MPRYTRVRSFSLDQLRLVTSQSVTIDEAPEVQITGDGFSAADEQPQSSIDSESKPKVPISYLTPRGGDGI